MQKKTKDIQAIILVVIVIAELLVYNSELRFTLANTYTIALLNLIVCVGFVFWYSKHLGIRLLLTLVTIVIVFIILFFEFVRDFSQSENLHKSWVINNYEIVYANQEYFAGPGSEAYLKLNRTFVFGMFNKDIEVIDVDSTFLKLGLTDCIVEFTSSKLKFDLCERKQLK